MDGGIDHPLSRIVFPGIEPEVKRAMKRLAHESIVGKPYLPIGRIVIIDRPNISLVMSPTMLLPQDVSKTNNAYIATMAAIHGILVERRECLETVDIIIPAMCCGYGKMTEDESIRQITQGIRDYATYVPQDDTVMNEQPKYYMNTEFFTIDPADTTYC